jgi:hypothetical protein
MRELRMVDQLQQSCNTSCRCVGFVDENTFTIEIKAQNILISSSHNYGAVDTQMTPRG